MRLRQLALGIAAPVVVAFACSQAAPNAPPEGNCPDDAGCPAALFSAVAVGASPTTGESCGQLATWNAACETCTTSSCCAQETACANAPDCVTLTQCVRGCAQTDPNCVANCEAQNTSTDGAAFFECMQTSCSAACLVVAAATTCTPLSFQSDSCGACMDQACCAQNTACANNSDCLAIGQCLQVCAAGDSNCTATCMAQSEAGALAFSALGQCMQASCVTPCQSTGVGASCGQLAFPTTACAACASQSCCALSAACANSPDCVTIEQCVQLCQAGDATCRANCVNLGPDGVTAFTALDACVRGNCTGQCP